ncbi:cobalamin biosynthesis protein CobG [Streptomyces sp. UNOC14_S4]|uniref:cobalamin biosynthesis protein CobG n=1 Tax=Streptomyces sp. UNOC14_S4 TaxID=2872340 RepID=UPI001E308744|nr:cobalamin biosynthesis protein CobG [Streptomyces sp. UNOC14_S4]
MPRRESGPPEPPGRTHGDRCPGALRLHAADDGALARVRLPGGLLTAEQAAALGRLAERFGDGHLDLTSRGNVQLRGLDAGCGDAVAQRLRRRGLLPSERHDRIRNVAASPLCGLDSVSGPGADAAVPVDVQAWTRELDGLLCADDADGAPADLTALSGRFLFGLDDGRGDIVALRPDVTLIASGPGQADLCFGAAGPGLRIAAADAPRAAALAAAEFLAAVRASGGAAWRVRDLPPALRPTADGRAVRLADAGIASVPRPRPYLPLGRPAEPGVVYGPDGRCALSVTAPLGRLTVAQWRRVVRMSAKQGADGEIRVTPWRGLVVPGFPAEDGPELLSWLEDEGFVTSPGSAWHRAGACAGRPGCAKSHADVRADAAACLMSPEAAAGLPVYWSGCERRCGHPGGDAWVDVLATPDGYEVAVREAASDGTGPERVRRADLDLLPGAVAAARSTATLTP